MDSFYFLVVSLLNLSENAVPSRTAARSIAFSAVAARKDSALVDAALFVCHIVLENGG